MHFQDLVAMIGISAAAGVALYMKFSENTNLLQKV